METENKSTISLYHSIIEKHTLNHPVVLACAELSIIKPSPTNPFLLDMAAVQIDEAINIQSKQVSD